jgi:hypothetical protein
MKPRVSLGLSILLLVIILASGWWLWRRLASTLLPEGSVTSAPARTPSPAAAAIAAAGTPAPTGYRLAGVALGDPDSFAVVETASGATALYRLHDEVAGLGELIRIEAERVVIRSATGQFELWLSPAATASPTAVRTPKPSTPTARRPLRLPVARTTPSPIS